jgi:hypothetical protein
VAFGGKSLLFSALMLAFVVMSHGYVAIMMPIALLGIICVPSPSLKDRLVRGLMMGVLGSTLSVWFWWPLIDNSKWTTPYGLTWVFENFFKEAIPIEIAPSILLTTVLFTIFMFLPKYFLTSTRFLFFWSGQLIIGIASIPILASLGVVNVRTIPHVQYVLCYLAASLLATALFREGLKSWLSRCALLTALLLPFIQWHVIRTSVNLSTGWINWNYTGWTVKDSYDSVQKISERLKGNFSDPRVVFEHDGAFNGAGTPRVFEMLPYFASRSTTDGLYMQSTILAPHMFYNQSTVSETPSCPFLEFGCAPKSFDLAVNYAPLLAVDTFILSAESTKEAARGRSDLEFLLSAPPWEVFKLRDENVRYIETLKIPPKSVSDKVWRTSFWEWFKAYQPSDPFLLRETPSKDWQVATLAASVDPEGRCAPKAEVNFNRILVTTDCPGKTHVLKFAYHDSWRSSGGEDLVLLSPGYIGIVPKSSKLELTFGQSFSWILSSYVSLCAWLIFFLGCLLQIAAIRRKMVPILVFLRISEN